MDEAVRVILEMNECAWQRLEKDLEGVTPEEAGWRPVPEANSINLILRHLRIDAQWHVVSMERTEEGRPHDPAIAQQPAVSMALDFEESRRALGESFARFVASLRTLALPDLRQRTLLAYHESAQGSAPEHFLGFHFALHLAAHDGQIRSLRNLYRKARGEPARFFPDNPTFPA